MRPIGCPEASVRNYHYSLRNNSEERSSHLLRRRSLTTRILCFLMWSHCKPNWTWCRDVSVNCFSHFPRCKTVWGSSTWIAHIEQFHTGCSSIFGYFRHRIIENRMVNNPFAVGIFQVSDGDQWVKKWRQSERPIHCVWEPVWKFKGLHDFSKEQLFSVLYVWKTNKRTLVMSICKLQYAFLQWVSKRTFKLVRNIQP